MTEETSTPIGISRRSLISGVAAGSLLFATGISAARQNAQFEQMSVAELSQLVRQTSDDNEAVLALSEIFARCGVAVYDEDATTMLTSLKQVPSPLAFTESQVLTMAHELQGDSWRTVGDFDDFGPTESESGDPVPAFSDMYAGYAAGAYTPGADFAREILLTIPEGEGEIPAALLPAPTAVVSMMTGEILANMQELMPRPDTVVPGLPSIPSLPGLPDLPPLEKTYELPPLPELNDAFCGNVQSFVTTVIHRVLAVLETSRTVVTIPILDQIFGGLIGVIKFGLKVIVKAIDIVFAPVMGVLKSIAAAVAIASNLVGTLTPWTISVVADPNMNRLGIGPVETLTGDILINAGGADDIAWPAVITGCARSLNLPVPTRTSAGASVNVQIRNPSDKELIVLGQEERRLDDTGRLTVTYATTNETEAEIDQGEEEIGVVHISATIEREDLRQFLQQLVDTLLTNLPTIIADVLRDLTTRVVNSLRDKIVNLTSVKATTLMYVTYHRMHCLSGQYSVVNTFAVMQSLSVGAVGGEGAMYWWFNNSGSCTMSWDGIALAWENGAASIYSGVAEGTFSVRRGEVNVVFHSTNIVEYVSDPEYGDLEYYATPEQLSGLFSSMTLACGDPTYLRSNGYGFILWLAPVVA